MKVLTFFFGVVMILLTGGTAMARGLSEDDLARVGYDQHIGQQISPDLMFQDSQGRAVALGDLRTPKPSLLVLGYYHCPMLCTLINDGLIESLQELRFNVGRDFTVINVSIDPNETPELAAVRKKEYLRRYGRDGAESGWSFLTGQEAAIAQLSREAGFRYRYDESSHQYAHPSGFVVLTPDGRISRYFFGVNFDPKELRSALIAASEGKRGSIIQQLVLLCCQYNPITGKYGQVILNVMRAGGIGTVVLLGWALVRMSRSAGMRREVDSDG